METTIKQTILAEWNLKEKGIERIIKRPQQFFLTVTSLRCKKTGWTTELWTKKALRKHIYGNETSWVQTMRLVRERIRIISTRSNLLYNKNGVLIKNPKKKSVVRWNFSLNQTRLENCRYTPASLCMQKTCYRDAWTGKQLTKNLRKNLNDTYNLEGVVS